MNADLLVAILLKINELLQDNYILGGYIHQTVVMSKYLNYYSIRED